MTQEFTEQLAKWEMHLHQLGYRKVVTCKECKREDDISMCPLKSVWDVMPEDFFCAKGERKDHD